MPDDRRRLGLPVTVLTAALLATGCSEGDPTTPNPPGDPPPPPATPTAVAFSTASPTLDRWGDTITLVARVLDQSGNPMTGQTLVFASSDTAVVRVASDGKVTSWKAGSATVSATAAGLSASLDVSVAVQRNPACEVPPAPAAPGPVRGVGSWSDPEILPLGVTDFAGFTMPMDVNGDGRIDLVMGGQAPTVRESYSQTVIVLNEPGGFRDASEEMLLDEVSPLNGPRDYALADLDGDGRQDAYVANPGYDPGGIDGLACGDVSCDGAPNAVLLAQAAGGVRNAAATALVPNPARGFTHSVDLGDVDCDGDPDVFEGRWPNGDAPEPSMLRVNTAGVFAEVSSRVSGGAITPASGSGFCDLDRDGDPELLVAAAPGPLRIFANDGHGRFRALPDNTLPPPRSPLAQNFYSDLNCADLDQDGWMDLIVHDHSFNANDGKWQVFRNRGDMVFEEWSEVLPDPEERYLFPTGGGSSMVYDFNADGWPDLLTGNFVRPLRILWNNGDGFTEQVLQGRWGEVMGAAQAIADLDGDGRLDVWMSMGGETPESWVIYQR